MKCLHCSELEDEFVQALDSFCEIAGEFVETVMVGNVGELIPSSSWRSVMEGTVSLWPLASSSSSNTVASLSLSLRFILQHLI